MKLFVAALSTLVVTAHAAQVKQTFFETFSEPPPANATVACPPNCILDPLPGPVNGLLWQNLTVGYVIGRFLSGALSSINPCDGPFYGSVAGTPVTLSSQYEGSCVKSWTLKSFGYGCNAYSRVFDPIQNRTFDIPLPANCTVDVEGYNKKGRCIGRETFHYRPVLRNGIFGLPVSDMTLFNTTKNGLKGKKVSDIKITSIYVPNPDVEFLGNLGSGIDGVTYTVFNRTRCS